MGTTHALPGELIDIRPFGERITSASSKGLFEADSVKMVRMVLPAGKVLKDHSAPGELIVQCIEGKFEFRTMGETRLLQPGDMLYLTEAEPHSVAAIEDSSFLLTIMHPVLSHESGEANMSAP